jgi:hypothetical protein
LERRIYGEVHHAILMFGAGGPLEKREVRDTFGEQPNYIGDQEFYATHVDGAVMIVRTTAVQAANRAAAILRDHAARTLGHKDAPAIRRID